MPETKQRNGIRVFHGFDALPHFVRPAVTVGSYDGVHLGHRALIGRLIAEARANGGESIVLTFEPHPRITLGKAEGLRLLTTLDEKTALLEELGVDISFAGIRPALSLPFGKGFDDIFTREQELELAALRLQPEEVEAVQWAGEAKVLAILEEGTFVPYHPGLVMLLFSLRNTRSSHTRRDPTRRNRRDP